MSKGANLAPRAWQKITASSLNLGGKKEDYPDYLKQIWDTGGYLTSLKEIYQAQDVPLIRQVLSDMGIFEDPGLGVETENLAGPRRALSALMDEHGDY
ncbi:hypothetical protein ACFL0H_12080 [Thermodesulfobacteriota bacterium]